MSPALIPPLDFWSRQAHAAGGAFSFTALDTPVTIRANTPRLLAAAELSARRYSRSIDDRSTAAPITVQLVERQADTPPPPEDWPEHLTYAGVDEWITLSAGEWGFGAGHLAQRAALVSVAPALAAQTQLISRYFIDHYILNLLFQDWAMLHASAVFDPVRGTLVVLVGDHNIGKSTTALRLLRAGWHFLADGMLLAQASAAGLSAGGYPIGEVKLRDDVLAAFPEYAGQAVRVREHRKTVVDLRAAHPGQIVETLIQPATVHLCFTERGDAALTTLSDIDTDTARLWLAANTVYWDTPERLAPNTATLEAWLAQARSHHLRLGSDAAGITALLEELR